MKPEIEQLATWLGASTATTVFTGAGKSTDSGPTGGVSVEMAVLCPGGGSG